jgi:coenzyme F420-reducing hydrogenase delta subunit
LAGDSLSDGDLKGHTLVFACSRSPLPGQDDDLIPVPCIGRVTVEAMLECLGRGADGVVLMCRDQATCPYGRGGGLGEQRAAIAEELAEMAGLGSGRVRCVQPPAGSEGPVLTLAELRGSTAPTVLQTVWDPTQDPSRGLDRAVALLRWLKSRPELDPHLPRSLAPVFAAVSGEGQAALYLGNLPELDLLLSLLVPGWRLRDVLAAAAAALEAQGIKARLVTSASGQREAVAGLSQLITLSRDLRPGSEDTAWDRLPITTLNELAKGTSAPEDGHGLTGVKLFDEFRFSLNPEERLELVTALASAPDPLDLVSPLQLAQIKLLTRQGSWQIDPTPETRLEFTATVPADNGEFTR